MFILGLNAFHPDAAACIVRDGELIAAVEEERFRRIKHWAGLPTEAVRYCLKEAGAELRDIDHIAVNREPGASRFRRLLFILSHRPAWDLVRRRLHRLRSARSLDAALGEALGDPGLTARVHRVEHHLAHLGSAFLVSGFEEAVCLSLDGFGDFASAAWGRGDGGRITIDRRIYFPHSLGIFYSAITQYLGFPGFGDEYKVMGLAACGQPRFLERMRELVRLQRDGTYRLNLKFFRHHTHEVNGSWDGCAPEVGCLWTRSLEMLLGPARAPGEPLRQIHQDIAASAQLRYEEALFALLDKLYHAYRCPYLALSGGCVMNSVANGKLTTHSPFRKIFLPPAPGDAGGAIGAALVVWNRLNPQDAAKHRGGFNLHNGAWLARQAYAGPRFGVDTIRSVVKAGAGRFRGCSIAVISDEQQLCARTARAIARGCVVGWYQGRMEWGPRALGNRSILCDPRRADAKDLLNLKIKRRESFRPFAPAILREHVQDWFEQDGDVPFMTQVFRVREDKRRVIPATTHVDGSGRLQTVRRDVNPLFYQLISSFCALTGVPLLLNTSFNESEPIVCRPEEALECFLRTNMDVLVMGHFFIQRRTGGGRSTRAISERSCVLAACVG